MGAWRPRITGGRRPCSSWILALLVGLGLGGCERSTRTSRAPEAPASVPDHLAAPRGLPGLDNVLEFVPGVINGSSPHGDEGFESLARLGVRTIICVDGAVPDVERARARAMRYVHLPLGYDGIPEERALQLARAVHDLPRPIYIHCHHGMHRSPAAAAAGLVRLGLLDPEAAVERMRSAGTAEAYTGLYAAAQAEPLGAAALEAVDPDFPERAEVGDFVALMAAISRTFDHMSVMQWEGWAPPPDHPDLEPAHEAGILARQFEDARRAAEPEDRPGDFAVQMIESVRLSERLAAALAESRRDEADLLLNDLRAACRACHQQYR